MKTILKTLTKVISFVKVVLELRCGAMPRPSPKVMLINMCVKNTHIHTFKKQKDNFKNPNKIDFIC